MVNVRGNDGAPASDFTAHQLRLDLLAPRDEGHLLRDHALARIMHLRNIAPFAVAQDKRPIRRCRLRQPLLNPTLSNSHSSPRRNPARGISLSRCELSHRSALTATGTNAPWWVTLPRRAGTLACPD